MPAVTQDARGSRPAPVVDSGSSGQLAHKVALSSGLNIAKQIIVLAGSVVVARVVGPEVLGTIAYAVAFIGLFASLSDLGFGSAHAKRVSEGWDLGQCMGMMWVAKVVALLTMTVAIVLAFIFGGSSSFRTEEQVTVFWLSLGSAVVGQLALVPTMTFLAFQDVYRKDLPPTLIQILNAGARLPIALVGLGAIGLASVDLVTGVAVMLVYVWLMRGLPITWPTRLTFRSYAIFGAPSFVVALLTSVGENMDRVLLGTFAGVAAVGQYSAGMRLGGLLQYLSQAVAGLVFPSLSRAYAQGNSAAAFELCAGAARRLSLVLLPPLLVAAGIANPLAVTLLGNQYSETGPVIVFGTMAMVFQILSQPYRQMLAGAEKMTLLVIGHALQFGVQAALLYGALSLIAAGQGILGPAPVTAMAMAGAALVGLAFWQAVVVRFLGAPADRALYIHLGSASGLFAVVYASNLLWTNRDIIAAILAFMAVVAHLGILRATGQLGQSEIAFLRELANPSRFRPSRLAVSPRRAA